MNPPKVEFLRTIFKFRKREEISSSLMYFLCTTIPIHTGPTPPLTSQTMLDACIQNFFRVSTLYRVGGERTGRKFRKRCIVLRGNREMTEKYEYRSTVPRTFVKDCRFILFWHTSYIPLRSAMMKDYCVMVQTLIVMLLSHLRGSYLTCTLQTCTSWACMFFFVSTWQWLQIELCIFYQLFSLEDQKRLSCF